MKNIKLMKRKFLYLILLLLVRNTIAQYNSYDERNIIVESSIKIKAITSYGLFSFYEVKNTSIYNKINSTGTFSGGIKILFDNRYSLGFIGGYNSIKPTLKGNSNNSNYFINTIIGVVKLYNTLLIRKRFDLYTAGAIGIKSVNKKLPDEVGVSKAYSWDIIIAGINYKITPSAYIFTEFGMSDFGFIKGGILF